MFESDHITFWEIKNVKDFMSGIWHAKLELPDKCNANKGLVVTIRNTLENEFVSQLYSNTVT